MIVIARKRTKEEAKRRIDELPALPPTPPFLRPFIPAPVRVISLLQRPARELAKVLVEADPLNRLEDETSTEERIQAAQDAFQILVNDPQIKIGAEELQMINDNDIQMASTGNGIIPISTAQSGLSTIRSSGQFRRDKILPRNRTRRKTKTDKKMSKALQEANARLRTKKGKLRKGKTQADVMRLAHRLRKRMK